MTIILDNYPPSTLQGVGLGGRKNPRIIRMTERGVGFKGGSLHDGFGGFDGFWRF